MKLDVSVLKQRVTLEMLFRDYGSSQDQHGRWRCLFPDRHQHGDQHHSVTIKLGRATCWSQRCFRKADQFEILKLMEGLPTFAEQQRRLIEIGGINGNALGPAPRQIIATYDYVDEQGSLLSQVVRYAPKDFRQRRSDGQGGWIWNLDGTRLVLYRLPQVLAAHSVLVVEGEKDVETAYRLGLPDGWAATCNPMGAEKWRSEYSAMLRGKRVVIIPDGDDAGHRHAECVAQALTGHASEILRVSLPSGFRDLAEWAETSGTGPQFHELLNGAAPADQQQTLTQLAALSPVEYDRTRKAAAQRLGVSVASLDQERAARRKRVKANEPGKGQLLELQDVDLWSHPVNGCHLIQHLTKVISSYVVFPHGAALASALWVIRAHSHDLWDINPRLAVTSPEKGCGKTTLLEVLKLLVPRPLLASNISTAAIFRVIEATHPTLLLDEMDSFVDAQEELRGILNSGHTREAAVVVRTVGDEHEPRIFSTWCPMVLAAIGRLPSTLEDRSIIIPMKRRAAHEQVSRLRLSGRAGAAIRADLAALASQVARWVVDHAEALEACDPNIPAALGLRAADNWAPLLAIAEVIGGQWSHLAAEAALALSGQIDLDAESLRVQLLADIREIFQVAQSDRLTSEDLCDRLIQQEEHPWGECNKGKPISQNRLAGLLRPFKVKSKTIRFPNPVGVQRGYYLEDFQDAFTRYLPSLSPDPRLSKYNTVTSRSSSGDSPLFESATDSARSTSKNGTNSAPDAGCSAVTDQKQENGHARELVQLGEVIEDVG